MLKENLITEFKSNNLKIALNIFIKWSKISKLLLLVTLKIISFRADLYTEILLPWYILNVHHFDNVKMVYLLL